MTDSTKVMGELLMMDSTKVVRELLMEFLDEVAVRYKVPEETLDRYVKLIVAVAREGGHE